jgi:YhcH/YjgK/YiaL family protein
MGYNDLEKMEVTEAYDNEKDRLFVKWEGQLMTYTEGMFAIFFPHDAHMPGIESVPGQLIKKAVIKVRN